MYFCAPAEGVSLEIGYQRTGQKRSDGATSQERSLTTSSVVWIQCTNVMDGGTDGPTGGWTPATAKTMLMHSVAR